MPRMCSPSHSSVVVWASRGSATANPLDPRFGIANTQLRLEDGSPYFIPNSELSK